MRNALTGRLNTVHQYPLTCNSGSWLILALFFFLFVAMTTCALAFPSQSDNDDIYVPAALVPWQEWVQHQQQFRLCPLISGKDGSAQESFLCAWPGKLQINADTNGMNFNQHWEIHERAWIPLPGNAEHWPQQVTVNGQVSPVIDHDNSPAILLRAGRYLISGNIPWQTRPQTLTIPDPVGLVELQVDGRAVTPVQRQGRELTLGRSVSPAVKEADNIQMRVYRKLTDGLPAFLTTQIVLHVSGKAREITLGPVLPDGFTAVSLENSSWRARFEGNTLQVQVQPGDMVLQLTARMDQPLVYAGLGIGDVTRKNTDINDNKAANRDENLPFWVEQEIWSYEAVPALRVTAITGGINPQVKEKHSGEELSAAFPVDPRQSGVPEGWQQLPAFVMAPGSALMVEERSRGLAPDESNRLTLARILWLNFDAKGFFARDTINGTLNHGWRLDMAPPFNLQRANDITPGQHQTNRVVESALLVTRGTSPGWSGVEWRNTTVALNTGARITTGLAQLRTTLPVNGWQQSFDEVNTQLRLPHGYLLLAAPGADHAYGSWIEQWNVLDVFFAAFVALLAWRLLGAAGGIMAACYLVLGMHQANAPMWTLATVLMLALLIHALPKGRLAGFCKWLQRAACLIFLLALLAFIPTQLRYALYPQLENTSLETFSFPSLPIFGASQPHHYKDNRMEADFLPREPAAMLPAPAALPSSRADEAVMEFASEAADRNKFGRARIEITSQQQSLPPQMMQKNLNRYSQATVVQTGGGEPHWSHGTSYRLHWSGPVEADQQFILLVSPPWLTRSLRIVAILMLGLLAWQIFCHRHKSGKPDDDPLIARKEPHIDPPAEQKIPTLTESVTAADTSPVIALLPLAALCFALTLPPMVANAQQAVTTTTFPPETMLRELQRRLNQPPACVPDCADIALAQVSAEKNTVQVTLEVHAATQIAFPLPQAESNLALKRVEINADTTMATREVPVLSYEGNDWIAIERGVRRVDLHYALNTQGSLDADASTSLSFPILPGRVLFSGKDWQVEGIDEDRLLNETLRFSRITETSGTAGTGKGQSESELASLQLQQFPPFVRIVRTLTLDLDWSIDTQVVRVAPTQGGFTMPVPLLAGEHVLTPGLRVQGGEVQVSLGSDEHTTFWHSRLDKTQTLQLAAPAMTGRAEIWRIRASAFWHIDWQGVPVNLPRGQAGDDQVFEFHPLPGEKLTLTLSQPEAIEGASRAIDQATLNTQIGLRATRYLMQFQLRASQGSEHVIELPGTGSAANAVEVLNVRRNSETLNLRPQDGKLTLPVSPGIQTFSIEMRQASEIGYWLHNPDFKLGLAAANINLQLSLPEQRWLLAASGPQVGPAVLYWGELIVAIGLAFLLGRSRITSLRFRHWLLLALGFSTFSWTALVVVIFWLIAIDWRERKDFTAYGAKRFDLMQIGLVLLTLAALGCLIGVIPNSLMGEPDMHVVGQGSYAGTLRWFTDYSDGSFPSIAVLSVPIWIYRALMLVWSLWLAIAVIGWLRRAFAAWTKNGYWRTFFNWPRAKVTQKPDAN